MVNKGDGVAGEGEINEEFGINRYTLLYTTRSYCVAQGTIFSIL